MLSGVRVVELASWTYVPSAGAALSDWGADVIKVEGVASGDPGRALVVGGFTREAARVDADFILELGNRGKRSIAIDVKSETGRELFGRLLASADVFLTNWLPGALERARLTVEDIRAFNPKIIIARGTGLGVRGPIAIAVASMPPPTWHVAGWRTRSRRSAARRRPCRGRRSVTYRAGDTRRWGVCRVVSPRTHRRAVHRRLVTASSGDVGHRAVDFGG
ncbi:coA-transferase III family protein [Mycobacterium kansasii]|uniref:CoA-transferase III family protein n=1 Tax=Mycobacterium kansasii TaxID=1768 RepID=A0A1V3X4Y1_MYCKA|nr:coA-transferase III family protein [Mycobacterium kansasii]